MKVKQFLALSLTIGLCLSLNAQNLVSKTEKRAEVIEALSEQVSLLSSPLSADPESLRNPFAAVRRPVVVAPVASTAPTRALPAEPALQARLSDAAALGVVVQRFKPLGAMVVGDRRILRLPGGTLLEEGKSFRIHIQGEFYDVFVDRVTLDAYVLRVGEARTERTLSSHSPAE